MTNASGESATRRRFLQVGSAAAATAALTVLGEEPAAAATIPLLDVTAYGATGDGSTDDRAAIQSAIAAGTALGPRFAVYLPIPTIAYALGAALSVPSGCSLLGEPGSRSRVLMLAASTGSAIVNSSSAGNTGIAVRNLEIDGNKAARSAVAAPLIKLASSTGTVSHSAITDCWLRSAPAGAIALEKAEGVEVSGNEISDITGASVSATFGTVDGRFLANFLHDNDGDHILVNAGERILISENILRTQSAGNGITLRGVSRAEVVGNLLDEPSQIGVLVANSGTVAATDIALSQNTIVDVGVVAPPGSMPVGIYLLSGEGGGGRLEAIRVERNTLSTSFGAGISAESLSASGALTDVVIGTNHVTCTGAPAGSVGIAVTGAVITDPVIASNTVVGAPGGGIVVGGSTATVARPTVSGNRIRDCAGIALRVAGAASPMIFGNRAVTTGGIVQTHGLRLEGAAGVVNEFGNDLSTSTVADVSYVGGGAQRARLGLGSSAVFSGTGDPNTSLPSAPIGSLFLRTDGPTAATTLYVRESAAPLVGWVAK